jgi:hypothetical protein
VKTHPLELSREVESDDGESGYVKLDVVEGSDLLLRLLNESLILRVLEVVDVRDDVVVCV